MHRIDTPGATAQNLFTDGDEQLGIVATEVDAAIMTALQEEVAGVVEEAGIVLVKGNNTQLATALGLSPISLTQGLKNLVINGAFDVWNRDTDPIATTFTPVYTADRWAYQADSGAGAGVATVTQKRLAGATDSPVAVKTEYSLQITQTVAPATAPGARLRTKLEPVHLLRNQQVTISFWVKVDTTGTLNLNVRRELTDVAVEAVVTDEALVYTDSGVWQQFEHTFTVPDYSTSNTRQNRYLELEISFPVGFGTFVAEVTNVQLELGSRKTGFAFRPLSLEQELCRRYFEISMHSPYVFCWAGGSPPAGNVNGFEKSFRTTKLRVPDMTWFVGGTDNVMTSVVDGTMTVTGQVGTSVDHTGYPSLSGVPFTVDGFCRSEWRAEADYDPGPAV